MVDTAPGSNDKLFRVDVIDTAGQDIFQQHLHQSLNESTGDSIAYLLVYGHHSHASIGRLESIFKKVEDLHLRKGVPFPPMALVGTQFDKSIRQVSKDERMALERRLGCRAFHDVSAKNNQKVKYVFACLAHEWYQRPGQTQLRLELGSDEGEHIFLQR